MSNPGVVTLTEVSLGRRKSFRVEDNLAESIHFHYRDMRIDLTIKELGRIAEICDETIAALVSADDFCVDDYDEAFLLGEAPKFLELKRVGSSEVSFDSLRVISKNRFGIPRLQKFSDWARNYCKKGGLKNSTASVPVVYNDGNILVGGIFSALEHYKKCPSAPLSIRRFYFEDNRYSISEHPRFDYFFRWDRARVKRALFKIWKRLNAKRK